METIKILIADDHPVVREGIRAMLETDEDIKVVVEANNGLESVAKTEELQPDVVLMDIVMPNLDCLEATRRIKKQCPNTAVIMLTIYSDKAFVINAIQAGAGGYLMKDASRDLLCHTIKAVHSGGMLIKSSLLREAVNTLVEMTPFSNGKKTEYPGGMAEYPGGMAEFTPKELEILKLLVEGNTNKEIGKGLFIAEDTAKKHVQTIIAKLGASDRTQAAVKAVRIGLVK